jgi:4-hydroxy-tetrahydrodipicolinate synthase
MKLRLHGVIPAALTPFREDLSLDSESLARHLSRLSRTQDVTGVLVNGNTSEVSACNPAEQEEIVKVAKSCITASCAVYSGIQLATEQSIRDTAKKWEHLGVDALVVYPPARTGEDDAGFLNKATALWSVLAAATSLPLIHFQYPASSGRGYAIDTLRFLADQVPNFCGVKDFCSDEAMHHLIIEEFQEQREIPVLTSHTRWLLESLQAGAAGIFSSAGSVFAKQQAEVLAEFRNNNNESPLALILSELLGAVSAGSLNEQVPKFKVAAKMRGDFSTIMVRNPCKTLSSSAAVEIEKRLAALDYS